MCQTADMKQQLLNQSLLYDGYKCLTYEPNIHNLLDSVKIKEN